MDGVPLHRLKIDLGTDTILDIESALGFGTPLDTSLPVPGLVAAERERDAEQISSGGIVPMRWVETGALFEALQLREDTDYFVDITVPISLADARLRSVSHSAWPFEGRLASVFKRDPSRRWKETRVGKKIFTTITGQLLLRSHAGILIFSTEFGGSVTVEVVCRKLGYADEFRALLDSVATKMAELLLAYDSPVSLAFAYGANDATNDAALYFQMRHVMSAANLPLAIEEIISNPHVRLLERHDVTLVEELEEADPELILDRLDIANIAKGGPLARFFGGFTPRELPQRVTFETADTPENRYAKAFLEQCELISRRLQARMTVRNRRAAAREADTWAIALEGILQKDLWREVGALAHVPSNSQVLLRKRGYRELVKCDLSLRMSLALPWEDGAKLADGLIGDVRPVNQIYEYWCFLSLFEILSHFCKKVDGGNFITVSKDGLRVQLARGESSETRFEFVNAGGARLAVSLYYNRRFRRPKASNPDWEGSYTSSFDPDFSISASPSDGGASHWLHFDAKYRLERQEVEGLFEANGEAEEGGESTSYEMELSRVHKQDDLFKMHTYRDGILGSRGAYILFPGDGFGGRTEEPGRNFFVRHPTALSGSSPHRIPSVGAFSLAPTGSFMQQTTIQELLMATFEAVASGKEYREEQGYFTL